TSICGPSEGARVRVRVRVFVLLGPGVPTVPVGVTVAVGPPTVAVFVGVLPITVTVAVGVRLGVPLNVAVVVGVLLGVNVGEAVEVFVGGVPMLMRCTTNLPAPPVVSFATVSATEIWPPTLYVCVGLFRKELVPSPKAQVQCPTDPGGVVVSVKATSWPGIGLSGVHVNSGVGRGWPPRGG